MGSVIALSSSTGAVLIKYSYDSFGLPKVLSGSTLIDFRNYTGNKYSNVRLFTGREHDRETGYYYMRARYYNAENSGRFISRDPIWQNDQVNLYTYVKNSPVMYTDRNWKKASQMIAFAETKDMYRLLLTQSGLWWSSDCSFYGWIWSARTSSTECAFYKKNFWLSDLYTAKWNKDLAEDNEIFNNALKSIRNSDSYKKIQANWVSNSEMMNTFGWNDWNNTKADAIRHSYWNALNAKDFWIDTAKKMWDYHEMLDGNSDHTVVMDLYNNSIGRSIWFANRDKTDEEILSIIVEKQDKLIYWIGWSDGLWQGNNIYNNVSWRLQSELWNELQMSFPIK